MPSSEPTWHSDLHYSAETPIWPYEILTKFSHPRDRKKLAVTLVGQYNLLTQDMNSLSTVNPALTKETISTLLEHLRGINFSLKEFKEAKYEKSAFVVERNGEGLITNPFMARKMLVKAVKKVVGVLGKVRDGELHVEGVEETKVEKMKEDIEKLVREFDGLVD